MFVALAWVADCILPRIVCQNRIVSTIKNSRTSKTKTEESKGKQWDRQNIGKPENIYQKSIVQIITTRIQPEYDKPPSHMVCFSVATGAPLRSSRSTEKETWYDKHFLVVYKFLSFGPRVKVEYGCFLCCHGCAPEVPEISKESRGGRPTPLYSPHLGWRCAGWLIVFCPESFARIELYQHSKTPEFKNKNLRESGKTVGQTEHWKTRIYI